MKIRALILTAGIVLTACTPTTAPDLYNHPSGYKYTDITPVSTPHGYYKTPEDEQAVRNRDAQNAETWRNAVAAALMPVVGALDMNTPVAIAGPNDKSFLSDDRLNMSVTNYARDMMVKMGYLTALPGEAGQMLQMSATPSKDKEGQTNITATALRGGVAITSHTATTVITGEKPSSWWSPARW